MGKRARDFLISFLIVLLAGTAFASGYFANDFLEQRVSTASASESEEEFDLFWEAWGWIQGSYLGEIPPMKQVTYGAIRGALSELGDPYTVFIEPPAREQERESLRGNFGGIGAHISRNEAGDVILEPIPGNPAEIAGILIGDVLLAIDGVEVSDSATVEEIAETIRGEKGTSVILTVLHPGASEPEDVTIERGDILIPSVTYHVLPDAPSIGYIRLSRFSGESSNEVATAIEQLQAEGAQGLILDLRQNGGGLLDAAVAVADHFLEDGPILYQQSKGQEERAFEATNGGSGVDIPLVVLVDGGTASASEILAGALQDRGRASLIGSPTFGKGSVQLVYDLSDGSSVHVTASRWLTPERHQIDQQGLQPDIPVEVTQEAVDAGQDLALDRAVEHLENRMANNGK
jgi:carboxyl-terminal processing protease